MIRLRAFLISKKLYAHQLQVSIYEFSRPPHILPCNYEHEVVIISIMEFFEA